MPMISFLANPMGIACLWMGEGFSYPEKDKSVWLTISTASRTVTVSFHFVPTASIARMISLGKLPSFQ
jgi:hypothetical protein